jgi:hypothetical protein
LLYNELRQFGEMMKIDYLLIALSVFSLLAGFKVFETHEIRGIQLTFEQSILTSIVFWILGGLCFYHGIRKK